MFSANTDIRKRLGVSIRDLRLARGITPQEFADDIGKNLYFVLQLEEGAARIDLATLEICSKALHVGISELFMAAEGYGTGVIVSERDRTEESRP